jgi:ribosomal protein S18 acetylase RimI-like enzyme
VPVTISKINLIDAKTIAACERIIASNNEHICTQAAWQTYLEQPTSQVLWLAVFNERVVGFSIVSGMQIKAFAVHFATQRRGVGQRMAQLLNEKYESLRWPTELASFSNT